MDKLILEVRLIDQAWEPTTGIFPPEFTGLRDTVKGFNGGHQYLTSTFLERIWLDK